MMGTPSIIPVLSGTKRAVPIAPLSKHLSQLSKSERPALIYNDEVSNICISYSQLESRTNSLARAVATKARAAGANRDGDYIIAVCMQPTHNTIMALLATWKVGAAYLPMETCFPHATISRMLTDARPALVIYDKNSKSSMFTNDGVTAVSFEELYMESTALSTRELQDAEMVSDLRSDSIAVVFYTSGSSGVSKGVRITHSAICNKLWWQFQTFPFSDTEETCLWKTTFTFADSVYEIWCPLLKGRALFIIPKETTRNPQKLVRILEENQIHRLILVPTLLRSILLYLFLNPSEKALTHLKLWICSGETLNKELAADFFRYFGDCNGYKLANLYGSTEVADATYYVLEKVTQLDLHATIPVGVPLDNTDIFLLDEEMNVVENEDIGQVWVAGANVAMGYVGGQTLDKFSENPCASHPDFSRLYRTGDYGMIQKGVLLFVGRTDSQVKIRGHRVDLQEVERAVAAVPEIDKCIVLCYKSGQENPRILSFVTAKPKARLSEQQIETTLQKSLTNYMRPQVILKAKLPLLVNGKIDRQALLKIYENSNNNVGAIIPIQFDYAGVDSQDMRAAQVLFETIGEVLGGAARRVISVRVGFYELGGNSLNSIYTITRLRDKGYFIDISDFLDAANLGEILTYLTTNPKNVDNKHEKFTVELLRDEHRQHVIDMMLSSFYEKGELHQLLKHEIAVQDYTVYINALWDGLLATGLNIVLLDETGTPVAVALNSDGPKSPVTKLKSRYAKIETLFQDVEQSVLDKVLSETKGPILFPNVMVTAANMSPSDNVAAIKALEDANIKIARERGFVGIFTSNTSPLTQQLARDILGYQTLLDYQVNQYVDRHGDRIFKDAPDDIRIMVCWKSLI